MRRGPRDRARSAAPPTARASSSCASPTARPSRPCSSRASPAGATRSAVARRSARTTTRTRPPPSTTRTSDDAEATAPRDPVRVTQCISTQVGLRDGLRLLRERRRRAQAPPRRRRDRRPGPPRPLAPRRRTSSSATSSTWAWASRSTTTTPTARSLRLLTHPDGIGLSTRRVTVSTSGLVPEIARLGADFGGNIGLAISLHAADDETRTRLMPINKKYPLASSWTRCALSAAASGGASRSSTRSSPGKNDARRPRRRSSRGSCAGLPVKINLIPMNPIEASTLGPPTIARRARVPAGALRRRLLVLHPAAPRRRRERRVRAARALGAKPKVRVNRV